MSFACRLGGEAGHVNHPWLVGVYVCVCVMFVLCVGCCATRLREFRLVGGGRVPKVRVHPEKLNRERILR